jgi:hypothetical protein
MNQHTNDMHSDLFHPIDEAMTFGETPETSECSDPLASFNTSPLLKGHNVNFESASTFRYDSKDGYPDFNLGTHPTTLNTAPVLVTHQAHSSVPSPATHQAHSAYVQNTSYVPTPTTYQVQPVTHQVHPVPHQVHHVYVNPGHVHMSLAQLMLLNLLRQRPSLHRMGRQCIRQVVRISYRNRIRMI